MLFSNIHILDEQFQHRSGCYVGVRDGIIAYIGDVPPAEDFGEVYDGTGRLLMPGFVNAHSHSGMTLMRGYGENLALSDWLHQRIFPFEAKLTTEAIYNGTMLAAAEMLRFGIVSTTEMYFDAAAIRQAVLDSGIKMNMGLSVTCFDDRGYEDLPTYSEMLDALQTCHGAAGGRLKLDAALHAEYTSTQKLAEGVAAFAREHGLRQHVHLSETKAEHEECKQRRNGRTPARYFYDIGFFDGPTSAAHCVWLEDEDFDLLAEKGVTAASCPVSNLKLASGFPNAPLMLSKGINYALGTDSVASNNNLNLMEEVKLFATLFKATTGDPTVVTPAQALYAATRAGALAQGRDDCGLVEEGFRADIIVMDLRNKPHMYPCHSMVNNVVFAGQGSDVCLTMVDGQVLYRDGLYTTLDVEAVIAKANESTEKILRQL